MNVIVFVFCTIVILQKLAYDICHHNPVFILLEESVGFGQVFNIFRFVMLGNHCQTLFFILFFNLSNCKCNFIK